MNLPICFHLFAGLLWTVFIAYEKLKSRRSLQVTVANNAVAVKDLEKDQPQVNSHTCLKYYSLKKAEQQ